MPHTSQTQTHEAPKIYRRSSCKILVTEDSHTHLCLEDDRATRNSWAKLNSNQGT